MKIEVTFLRRAPFVEMRRVDPPSELLGFEVFGLRQKVDHAADAGRFRSVVETIDTLAKSGRGNNALFGEITHTALHGRTGGRVPF